MEMLVIVPIFVIIGIRGFYLMGKWDDFLRKNFVSEEEKTVSAEKENISDGASDVEDDMDIIREKKEKYFHISDVIKSHRLINCCSFHKDTITFFQYIPVHLASYFSIQMQRYSNNLLLTY